MVGETAVDIIQSFYDNLASKYDKLFLDWGTAAREQAEILHKIFISNVKYDWNELQKDRVW